MGISDLDLRSSHCDPRWLERGLGFQLIHQNVVELMNRCLTCLRTYRKELGVGFEPTMELLTRRITNPFLSATAGNPAKVQLNWQLCDSWLCGLSPSSYSL